MVRTVHTNKQLSCNLREKYQKKTCFNFVDTPDGWKGAGQELVRKKL